MSAGPGQAAVPLPEVGQSLIPVLQVRERLLVLPMIGALDVERTRELTDQLLRAIRTYRAQVVVVDITGVAAMDETAANHLVLAVEASRLLGATVIVSGMSPEIALTLVSSAVDLSEVNTVVDLQGAIEEGERRLACKGVQVGAGFPGEVLRGRAGRGPSLT